MTHDRKERQRGSRQWLILLCAVLFLSACQDSGSAGSQQSGQVQAPPELAPPGETANEELLTSEALLDEPPQATETVEASDARVNEEDGIGVDLTPVAEPAAAPEPEVAAEPTAQAPPPARQPEPAVETAVAKSESAVEVPVAEQAPEPSVQEPMVEEPAAAAPEPAAAAPGVAKQAAPSAEPAGPTLDLDGLEASLRKTKAIGLFTKLELKNQVEDLVKDLEDYHRNKSKLSLTQLEERFDLLVMKLLVLLQDGDPPLHQLIASARPALWTTLADPDQFANLKGT